MPQKHLLPVCGRHPWCCGGNLADVDCNDMGRENTKLVVTTCKVDHETVVRIDRIPSDMIDYSKVAHAASGPYTGIYINKPTSSDTLKYVEKYHQRFKFVAYLSPKQKKDSNEHKESREVRLWFSDLLPFEMRKEKGREFFNKLTTPETFPKEYAYFIRRTLLLTHLRDFIDSVELHFRPYRPVANKPPVTPKTEEVKLPPPKPPKEEKFVSTAIMHVQECPIVETAKLITTEEPKPSPILSTIENFITVLTPAVYDYQYLTEVAVSGKTSIGFRVKAKASAYVALSSVYGDTLRKTYEVAFGTENNTRCEIRYGGQGPIMMESVSYNVLNQYNFKDLWISWEGSRLVVGEGREMTKSSELISWEIPDKYRHSINCLSVSTDKNSEGTWEFVEMIDTRPKDDSQRRAAVLSKMRLLLLWFAKKQRMLQILEDAFPDTLTTDELLITCKVKQSDVMQAIVFLKELQKKKLINEVMEGSGNWIRVPTTSGLDARSSHEIRFVSHLPAFDITGSPTVAIITTFYCEKVAIDAMMDHKTSFIVNGDSESSIFTIGKIGDLTVVATKLSRSAALAGERCMISDGNATARLLLTFNRLEHVLVVGVGGGVPSFCSWMQHVRRGDVVVSVNDRAKDAYLHCVKIDSDPTGFTYNTIAWRPQHGSLSACLSRIRHSDQNKDWRESIERGLDLLQAEESSFHKPELKSDKLFAIDDDALVQVEHPEPHDPSMWNQNSVKYGSVASGKYIPYNFQLRMDFGMRYGIKAFDQNLEAVLDSLEGSQANSWAVIRGISDYADGTTDKVWQPYASLTAAAYARAAILALSSKPVREF